MSRQVTMADVARETGVSLMTVSRIVNNKGNVSDETRQRVLQAIQELGYSPSQIARSLVTKQTGTLGLVVPDNANPFFSEVARGVEHLAYAEGYNVFLCNTEEDAERELTVLQSLAEQRVDGLILVSSRLQQEQLRTAVLPHPNVVLLNRMLDDDHQTKSLMIDDRRIGFIATQHLIRSGHEAVAFLAGPQSSHSGSNRLKGYRDALNEADISYADEWALYCSPTVDGGKQAADQLLKSNPEVTALFCHNDLVAVGALQTCAERGYRVPEDIAVVGCDDIYLATLVTPPLTTIHIPKYEMGKRAIEILLDDEHGYDPVFIESTLVKRDSAP